MQLAVAQIKATQIERPRNFGILDPACDFVIYPT
jgi:hypothetical protein